jgi:hypothetical protein
MDPDTGAVRTFPVLLKKTALLTGEAVETARVEIGNRFKEPHVALTFNDRGARLFEKITQDSRTIITSSTVIMVLIPLPASGGRHTAARFCARAAHRRGCHSGFSVRLGKFNHQESNLMEPWRHNLM